MLAQVGYSLAYTAYFHLEVLLRRHASQAMRSVHGAGLASGWTGGGHA